jgi:hypothetical protein
MAAIKFTIDELQTPLPLVCAVCGNTARRYRRKRFNWHPRWVWLMLPVAGLATPFIKTVDLNVPLCEDHRHQWGLRTLMLVVGLVVWSCAAVSLGVVSSMTWPWLLWAAGAAAWVVMWVKLFPVVYVTDITDHEIVLAGVAPDFVETILNADEERKAMYETQRPVKFGYGPAWYARHAERSTAREVNIQDKQRPRTPDERIEQ